MTPRDSSRGRNTIPARSQTRRVARQSGSPATKQTRVRPDKHVLYEASVQGAEYDLDFMERVYSRRNGRTFRRFREDFCGTALVAAAWALRRPGNLAWGVDLDRPTLEWARRHRLARLGEAASRVRLVQRDVRAVGSPAVDVVAALNFSYWVFHRRPDLLAYFRAVRRSLLPGGLFFLSV